MHRDERLSKQFQSVQILYIYSDFNMFSAHIQCLETQQYMCQTGRVHLGNYELWSTL